MTTIKETIPFNFDDVYAYVEQKFKETGYDTQEGSNTMQLVTSMSYLVSMLNANTAANINETILPLARKRSVALNDARVLGYEIEHIQSYQYSLQIQYSTPGTYRINKYDSFSSGGKTYYYFGNTTESFTVAEGETVTRTISVKEGTLKKYTEESTLTTVLKNILNPDTQKLSVQEYVDVPFTKIEQNGIEMFLTYYDEQGNLFELEEWTKSQDYIIESDIKLDKKFVRLDNIDYGTPRLYFKIGNSGKNMRVGTIVNLNILESSGVDGEMTDTPTDDSGNGTVVEFELLIQGAEEETLESIKTNAPLFYNTANRVVTRDDYKTVCNKQTAIENSVIWDGQDEYPVVGGNVWFSFIPSTKTREFSDSENIGYTWSLQNAYDTSNWYIEEQEVQEVFGVLDEYKIPTLVFNHRNPIYLDFEYTINIPRYVISTSESDINEGVFNVINRYFEFGDSTSNGPIESFDFDYFHSNLIKRVDKQLTENMGCNTSLSTSINLNERLVTEETIEGEQEFNIKFNLGIPFSGIYTNDVIDTSKLPNISTENIVDGKDLFVDFGTEVFDAENGIFSYEIKLTPDELIGEYRVYIGSKQRIEVILYISANSVLPENLSTPIAGELISENIIANTTNIINNIDVSKYTQYELISFGDNTTNGTFYKIESIDTENNSLLLDKHIEDDLLIGDTINSINDEAITPNGRTVTSIDYEYADIGPFSLYPIGSLVSFGTNPKNRTFFEIKNYDFATRQVGLDRIADETVNIGDTVNIIATGTGATDGLNYSDLIIDTENSKFGMTLDLTYGDSNIPLIRNTIPRLKKVDFT